MILNSIEKLELDCFADQLTGKFDKKRSIIYSILLL